MPVYTYHCDYCEHEFDKHQSFSEEALVICPVCRKHRLRKVYSPAGVVFKGSGFYVTDKKAPSPAVNPAPTKGQSNGKDAKESSKTVAANGKEAAPKTPVKETKTS